MIHKLRSCRVGMVAEKDSPHTESNVANICSTQRDLENTDHMAPREREQEGLL